MSKKSRRRNKKILGALALLGTGLALANRGKGTEMSNISVDSGRGGNSSSAIARAIANTPEENTFKVQDVKVNVPSKKPVVNLGRMEGQGPESGVVGQKKRSNYVQRAKDAAAANAMRAFRSNNAYRGNMMTTPDSILRGMPESALMAKKGGRIVKGKKTAVRKGAAKRGFGRAFKGGK